MARRRKGSTGGSTGSIEYSPEKVKRMEAQMKRTEQRWASMAGPVEVRQAEPTVTARRRSPR